MVFFVVADVVGKHCADFLLGKIFDQGIKKGNALFLAQTRKVGVCLGGSFGTVDDKDVFQFKSHLGGIVLDGPFQAPIVQGGLLVEQGNDEPAVEQVEKKDDHGYDSPGIEPKIGPAALVEQHQQNQKDSSQKPGEQSSLQLVNKKQSPICFVEPIGLFNDKGPVIGK